MTRASNISQDDSLISLKLTITFHRLHCSVDRPLTGQSHRALQCWFAWFETLMSHAPFVLMRGTATLFEKLVRK